MKDSLITTVRPFKVVNCFALLRLSRPFPLLSLVPPTAWDPDTRSTWLPRNSSLAARSANRAFVSRSLFESRISVVGTRRIWSRIVSNRSRNDTHTSTWASCYWHIGLRVRIELEECFWRRPAEMDLRRPFIQHWRYQEFRWGNNASRSLGEYKAIDGSKDRVFGHGKRQNPKSSQALQW